MGEISTYYELIASTAARLDGLSLQSIASFLVLVLSWSILRPSMIRDFDNRRLPYNTTARLAYAIASGFLFIALALLFHGVAGAAEAVKKAVPILQGFAVDHPPLLAVMTLGVMLQFSFFRDLERSAIIWLHSRRHVSDDVSTLAQHLERCGFKAAIDEQRKNREMVRQFGVYITDETFDGVGLITFHKWRKASSLLRVVREWNEDETKRLLSGEDMELLASIETAHKRKTELALTIVKMYDEVQQGGEASKALASMLKLLSDTPHVDRASVEAAENRARIIISGAGEQVVQRPLRLTQEQIKSYLVQIERYFELEYAILLEQAAALAAKSIVMAGKDAADRLQQLKQMGFEGLGRIQNINLDRVLWLFLVVGFGGFLVMYLGYSKSLTPALTEALARFTIAMSIAALIGAFLGSRRSYSRKSDTPWSSYMAGGTVAGLMFAGLVLVSQIIRTRIGIEDAPGQPPFSLYRMLPWALLPAITTIAIARLARFEGWPEPPQVRHVRSVYARALDGLCVSVALLAAYALAIALHFPMGIEISPALKKMMEEARFLPIPINWTVQALGFFIGFCVVRDVRKASHSTIVAKPVKPEDETAARPSAANDDGKPPVEPSKAA